MNTDKFTAESIASGYIPHETSKITALRKLDRRAKAPARVFTFTFGSAMTLVFGTGMCLAMGVIGGGTTAAMGIGIAIGILGIIGCCVNYPIYRRILEAGKEKYAFEIMQLAREISEEAE